MTAPLTAVQQSMRTRLTADRERILAEIESEQERRRVLADSSGGERYGNHPGDEGSDTFDKESSLAIQASLEAMLAEINHALHRIDEGTYGVCENCGQPIPVERLEIRPQATLCITCKSKLEHDAQSSQSAFSAAHEPGVHAI
ncbi:MAG TPA: TraR/DksA C4-type zinc finger protein [Chloroflexota bacterium]|nr:TraR/DksA C4-type zinc finger protein [Chloroflexota bacterium]